MRTLAATDFSPRRNRPEFNAPLWHALLIIHQNKPPALELRKLLQSIHMAYGDVSNIDKGAGEVHHLVPVNAVTKEYRRSFRVGLTEDRPDHNSRVDSDRASIHVIRVLGHFAPSNPAPHFARRSVEVALGMVDREDWRGVEVGRVRGRRGLVKLVNNNSSSSNDEERTPAFDVKKNVMGNWPKSGNPLHPPSEEDNEEHSNPEEEDSQRQSSDNTSTLWPGSQQNVFSDEEDEDQNPFWREISVNWDQDPPTTTLTVLNGLTKFIGKYMDIIRTLPSITTDVASGMQRLVDMYFLCVINVALNGAQPEEVWAKTTSADQNWMEKMGDMMHGRRLEMCRPVEAESNEYESVINFIRRARKKIGQLEVTPAPATYEAKISALESLMFLAALLSSIQSKIPTLNAYIDEVRSCEDRATSWGWKCVT